MRKIAFSMLLVAASLAGFSQGAKIIAAKNYMSTGPEIDKAKDAIDLAVVHEKTISNAKAWFIRGQVYYALHIDLSGKYDAMKTGALDTANASYNKALQLDYSKLDMQEFEEYHKRLADVSFDYAVQFYNAKDYMQAVHYFDICSNIKDRYKIIDTVAIYNSGLSAELGNNIDVAAKYYKRLAEMGYKGSRAYTDMVNMYLRAERDDDAMEVLKIARKQYPSDQDLLTAEINLYLKHEKFAEALENLNLAVQGDPNNATMYFARGVLYNRDNKNDEAEKDYLKAIELKSDYFDAYYNLGALYFNQAADYLNQVNQIKDNAKYAAEKKKADAMFEKSLPILEKAHELNAKDQPTISSLMQLYGRMNKTDKYNEMKALLD